jgi:hypothetical protein
MRDIVLTVVVLAVCCCGKEALETPGAGDAEAFVDAPRAQLDGDDDLGARPAPVGDAFGVEEAQACRVPAAPPFPELAGGSVEDVAGNGWDYCNTRTPGALDVNSTQVHASHNDRFMRFSAGSCKPGTCRLDNPSAAQLYFWWPERPTTAESTELHFDAINLLPTDPAGTLSIFEVDGSCESEVLLRTVALADLKLDSTWSDRGIALPVSPTKAIGLAVTGQDYDVGFDAMRLERPCR